MQHSFSLAYAMQHNAMQYMYNMMHRIPHSNANIDYETDAVHHAIRHARSQRASKLQCNELKQHVSIDLTKCLQSECVW